MLTEIWNTCSKVETIITQCNLKYLNLKNIGLFYFCLPFQDSSLEIPEVCSNPKQKEFLKPHKGSYSTGYQNGFK